MEYILLTQRVAYGACGNDDLVDVYRAKELVRDIARDYGLRRMSVCIDDYVDIVIEVPAHLSSFVVQTLQGQEAYGVWQMPHSDTVDYAYADWDAIIVNGHYH